MTSTVVTAPSPPPEEEEEEEKEEKEKEEKEDELVKFRTFPQALAEILTPATKGYRDFSTVLPPGDFGAPRRICEMTFPQKVHHMLSNPDFEHFVTWMPHGRAFRVLVPQLFEIHVCPQYFGHRSYARFRRELIENGFKYVPSGKDQNCYYHELMLKHRFFLSTFVAYEKDETCRRERAQANDVNGSLPQNTELVAAFLRRCPNQASEWYHCRK